jgi:hypothetical protein
VYAAADNSQTLSHKHRSRINQAVFISGAGSGGNSVLGVVYENMVFDLLNLDGSKVRPPDTGLGNLMLNVT